MKRECVRCFEEHTLPDIEMYGGDTLPWEVTLIREDGSKFSFDTASECTATLTFTPLKASTGMGNNAVAYEPVLTKSGVVTKVENPVKPTLDGNSIVVFTFNKEDTIGLRGKFIYQIEIKHDEDLRLCQGSIYIRQNINRE